MASDKSVVPAAQSRDIHATRMVWVMADIDLGIAGLVFDLNRIDGVRTFASCQGTMGEGGPHPYRAYVMCSWRDTEVLAALQSKYIVRVAGDSWGYVHPLDTVGQSDGIQGGLFAGENRND